MSVSRGGKSSNLTQTFPTERNATQHRWDGSYFQRLTCISIRGSDSTTCSVSVFKRVLSFAALSVSIIKIYSPDGLGRVEQSTKAASEWTATQTRTATAAAGKAVDNYSTTALWQRFKAAQTARPVNNVTISRAVKVEPVAWTVTDTWQPTLVAVKSRRTMAAQPR